MNLAILAITAFCRVAAPQSLAYAPDWLAIPYPVTNIIWHIDETVEPPREWAETNVTTAYRTELHPTPADYLAQNWLYNCVSSPTNREGYVAHLDRYEARGEAVYAVYGYEPIPYVPRRIYKYDLSTACIEYGEITNLITLISADVGTKWMWDAAEILVENDPWFVAATNSIITEGIISETKVKAIIERAVELGQITNANAEAK